MFRFLSDRDVRESARAHRLRLLGAAGAMLLRAILALGGPFFLGRTLDVVKNDGTTSELWTTVALLGAFALGTAFGQFWMRLLWIGWSRFTERRMRDSLFVHLMSLSPPFFNRSRVGDLLSRLTSDVEAVRMGYGPGVMHCGQTVLLLIGALGFMLSSSVQLTLLAFIPLVALFICLFRLLPRIHEASTRVQEEQAAMSTRAQEAFSGARVIKAFAREPAENRRFGELARRYQDASMNLAGARGLFSCLIEGSNALVMVIVLLVGGHLVLESQITLGEYVAFVGYLNLMIWPMIAISWTLSLFQRADAARDRLQALHRERPEIEPGTKALQEVSGAIEVSDLAFRYGPEDPLVLEGISFQVQPGRTLGIVGATASGKTTLVQILLRLEDPPPGTVFLDGHDVRDLQFANLRGAMALVPQETFLFGDTIEKNLVFGIDSATPDAIADAVHRSCLDQDMEQFPDGLDTVVGERGVTLSGGQRQRVAIARALLCDAPILLLDDALSAVDTQTEQTMLQRLGPVLAEKTTIIVSHRLSSVATADEIIVLDEGRVAERGDHDTLLARGGRYARLWRMQKDERELERYR